VNKKPNKWQLVGPTRHWPQPLALVTKPQKSIKKIKNNQIFDDMTRSKTRQIG